MAARQSESHWALWTGLALFSVLVAFSISMFSPQYNRNQMVGEAQKIEAQLGHDTLLSINKLADAWYFTVLPEAEIPESFRKTLYESKWLGFLKLDPEEIEVWCGQRLDAALDLFYWFLRRMALFCFLVPFWMPMFSLSVVHGLLTREIKKKDFGYTSPIMKHASFIVIRFFALTICMMFVVPIALDPVIFVFLLIAIALVSSVAMSNIQK